MVKKGNVPWNKGNGDYMRGDKHFMWGKNHTEESKKKIGIKSLEMWKKPNMTNKRFDLRHKDTSVNEIIKLFREGKNLKEIYTFRKVSEPTVKRILFEAGFSREDIMKRAKKTIGENTKKHRRNQIFPVQDTSIELKIQGFLKKLRIEFVTHQYLNIKHDYQTDIFIPSKNLVIECYGNYWHHYPLGNELDGLRCQELRAKGFNLLVLWENEIKVMQLNDLQNQIQ